VEAKREKVEAKTGNMEAKCGKKQSLDSVPLSKLLFFHMSFRFHISTFSLFASTFPLRLSTYVEQRKEIKVEV
jgi:hypothetical protein